MAASDASASPHPGARSGTRPGTRPGARARELDARVPGPHKHTST